MASASEPGRQIGADHYCRNAAPAGARPGGAPEFGRISVCAGKQRNDVRLRLARCRRNKRRTSARFQRARPCGGAVKWYTLRIVVRQANIRLDASLSS
jgi:hypothetical protein